MTDSWRSYFVLRPPPPATMSTYEGKKILIQNCLIKPNRTTADNALHTMCEMIDTRAIYVLAISSRIAQDFGRAINRRINYVSDKNSILGIQGVAVILLGDWSNNTIYREIMPILRVRKEIDIWHISDWRPHD